MSASACDVDPATTATTTTENPLLKVVFVSKVLSFSRSWTQKSETNNNNNESSNGTSSFSSSSSYVGKRPPYHILTNQSYNNKNDTSSSNERFRNTSSNNNNSNYHFEYPSNTAGNNNNKKNSNLIPEMLRLRDVCHVWSETVLYYSQITSEVIAQFCDNIKEFIYNKHPTCEHYAEIARDALIYISRSVNTPTTLMKWLYCVYCIVDKHYRTNQIIFGRCEELKETLILLSSEKVLQNSDAAVQKFCQIVEILTKDDAFNQKLYATTEMLNSFLSISDSIKSSSSCYYWCYALCSLTEPQNLDQLFGCCCCRNKNTKEEEEEEEEKIIRSLQLREKICRVSKFVKKEGYGLDSKFWCLLLHNLTSCCNNNNNDETNNDNDNDDNNNNSINKKLLLLFSVESIRDLMFDVSIYVNDSATVYYFCRVLFSLSKTEPKLFSVCASSDKTPKILLQLFKSCKPSWESMFYFLLAVKTMIEIDKNFLMLGDSSSNNNNNNNNNAIATRWSSIRHQVIEQKIIPMINSKEEEEKVKHFYELVCVAPEVQKRIWKNELRNDYGYKIHDKNEIVAVNREYVKKSQILAVEISTLF